MTTAPQWSPVDSDTADLLSVLADDGSAILSKAEEWSLYVECLHFVAMWDLDHCIDPNHLRKRIGGRIKPQRVGAFTHRALSKGLVEYTGRYVISNDTEGRNGGKPCREMRWIG